MRKASYYLILIVLILLTAACGTSNHDDYDSSADDPNASAPLGSSKTSALTYQSNSVAPQIIRSVDHGGGYGWKKDRCFLCHSVRELKIVHGYSPALAESLSRLGEADFGACLYCHGSNGLSEITPETYQCMACHTDSSIVNAAHMFEGHNMHDVNGDGWLDNADCLTCHAFSDMNGEINVAIDFRKGASDYANLSEFCLNCHDGNGAFGILPPELSTGTQGNNIYFTYKGIGANSSVQKQTADIHGARNGARWNHGAGSGAGSGSGSGAGSGSGSGAGSGSGSGAGSGSGSGAGSGSGSGAGSGSDTKSSSGSGTGSGSDASSLRGAYTGGIEVACLDCHQVHSSDNPYLITQSGASAELADETARAAAVVVTENNFTQLCAVCHTSLDGAPTDNGLTQVVHPGTYSAYCTDCHYHGAGFGADKSGLF